MFTGGYNAVTDTRDVKRKDENNREEGKGKRKKAVHSNAYD